MRPTPAIVTSCGKSRALPSTIMAAAITVPTALIASERTGAGAVSANPRFLRSRTARIAHRCTYRTGFSRTDITQRRGWDSNPRNGLPLGRFQGACTSPLCDLASAVPHARDAASIQILADRYVDLWHAVGRESHRRTGTRPSRGARAARGRDPSPGPHEVLIKVVAAGVNRADLLQRQGHYQTPPGVSTIIGLEVSGTVAEVGEEVHNWSVDDPCIALLAGGGYAGTLPHRRSGRTPAARGGPGRCCRRDRGGRNRLLQHRADWAC